MVPPDAPGAAPSALVQRNARPWERTGTTTNTALPSTSYSSPYGATTNTYGRYGGYGNSMYGSSGMYSGSSGMYGSGGGMYGNSMYGSSFGGGYRPYGGGMYGGSYGGGYGSSYGSGYGGGMYGMTPYSGMAPSMYGQQDPNGPPMPPSTWQAMLHAIGGVVHFFGRLSFLVDENAHAVHFFISALLQLLDRFGSLYGELARFVLRLLGYKGAARGQGGNPEEGKPGAAGPAAPGGGFDALWPAGTGDHHPRNNGH